jgi:hypothetical protein
MSASTSRWRISQAPRPSAGAASLEPRARTVDDPGAEQVSQMGTLAG